mgnify:CR=1 FL=1
MKSTSKTLSALIAIVAISFPAFAGEATAPQDGITESPPLPVSVVPAARTEQWAVAREAELLRRARESGGATYVGVAGILGGTR